MGAGVNDGKRPTMRDVAARAGVSLKTVSRVVNDESGVSPALVGRVRQAVDDLGFRPNVGARVLRRADARRHTQRARSASGSAGRATPRGAYKPIRDRRCAR